MRTKLSKYKKYSIVLVLALMVAFAALNNAFDNYMKLLVGAFIISFVIMAITAYMGADKIFATVSVLLINIGLIFQAINGSNNCSRIQSLYLIALVLSIISVGVIIYGQTKLSSSLIQKILAILVVVLYVVMLIFGTSVNGVKAWLNLGMISFQVSELTKFITVLFWAICLGNEELSEKRRVIECLIVYGLNFMVLMGISEIGTLVVLSIILMALLMLCINDIRYSLLFIAGLLICITAGTLILYVMARLYDNHVNFVTTVCHKLWSKLYLRFDLWKHPDQYDQFGLGYQYSQAMKALHLAGWLGNSKYSIFVPAGDTDYAFVSLVSYMGVIMGEIIILLYTVLFVSAFKSVYSCESTEKRISVGMILVLTISTFLTFFGSVGFIPISGMPLSFISYGGSNFLISLSALLYILVVNSNNYEAIKSKIMNVNIKRQDSDKDKVQETKEVVLCRIKEED